MRSTQISHELLLEYGSHGFPGFGRRLFKSAHWGDIARLIYQHTRHDKLDDHMAEAVIRFFATVLREDSSSFDAERFAEIAKDGGRFSRGDDKNPDYEQRQLYYLAHVIRRLPAGHMREWIAHWLGDAFERRNHKFREELWFRECGVQPDSTY